MTVSHHLLMQPIPLLYQPMKVLWLFMFGMVGLVTFVPKAYSQSGKANNPPQSKIPVPKKDTSLVKPNAAQKFNTNTSIPISKYSLLKTTAISKPSFHKPKEVPSKFSGIFKFSGAFSVESVYNSWQDPYSQMPTQYTRVYFTPSISVLGIPIKTNILYSTEPGASGSQLKNMGFGLDMPKLQQNIVSGVDIKQNELLRHESLEQGKPIGFDIKPPASVTNLIPPAPKVPGTLLNDLPDPDMNQAKMLANIKKLDKLSAPLIQRMQDSLENSQPGQKNKLDSLLAYKRILDIQDEDAQQRAEDSLEKTNPEKYKAYHNLKRLQALEKYRQGNLQNAKSQLENSPVLNKTQKLAMKVKKFNIGDSYAQYTPFTLSGIKITGVDAVYTPQRYYFALTAGSLKQWQ